MEIAKVLLIDPSSVWLQICYKYATEFSEKRVLNFQTTVHVATFNALISQPNRLRLNWNLKIKSLRKEFDYHFKSKTFETELKLR